MLRTVVMTSGGHDSAVYFIKYGRDTGHRKSANSRGSLCGVEHHSHFMDSKKALLRGQEQACRFIAQLEKAVEITSYFVTPAVYLVEEKFFGIYH